MSFLEFLLVIWMPMAFVTFPFATRTVYNRKRHEYTSPIHAYRDAVSVGACIAVFWPVTLPAAGLYEMASATARITAPPEVKKAVNAYNVQALERVLGVKEQHELEWHNGS